MFEADEPDHLEDVSAFVATKLAALLQHKSQLHSTMGITEIEPAETKDNPEVVEFKRRVTDRLASQGLEAGFEAAEAFKRIDNL